MRLLDSVHPRRPASHVAATDKFEQAVLQEPLQASGDFALAASASSCDESLSRPRFSRLIGEAIQDHEYPVLTVGYPAKMVNGVVQETPSLCRLLGSRFLRDLRAAYLLL